MRVLLQNTETKLYFIDINQWTDDPLKATDFEEVQHAAHAYHSQGIAYAQIVIDSSLPSVQPQMVDELVRQLQVPG
jgi:hypothetical protein